MQAAQSKFPVNRVIAFAGPYIAVASGVVADWLVVHLHILGLFHTTSTQVASAISQLVVFGLTALLVWLGHQKWLTGWQKWEAAIAGGHADGPEPPPGVHPSELGDYDPTTAGGDSEPAHESVAPNTTVEGPPTLPQGPPTPPEAV